MWPTNPVAATETFPKLQFLDSNEFWIVWNQTPYQFECCSANEFKTSILKVVLTELFLVVGQVGALFLGSRLCDFHLCMARSFQGFRTTQPRNRQHFDLVLKEVGPLNWPHCLQLCHFQNHFATWRISAIKYLHCPLTLQTL